MDEHFCLEAVDEAFSRYGTPDIFKTDQGSQFTNEAITGKFKKNNIRISKDWKGSLRDNVFVERLWRTIKYEVIYLKDYDSVSEVTSQGRKTLSFYNEIRTHYSLDGAQW